MPHTILGGIHKGTKRIRSLPSWNIHYSRINIKYLFFGESWLIERVLVSDRPGSNISLALT